MKVHEGENYPRVRAIKVLLWARIRAVGTASVAHRSHTDARRVAKQNAPRRSCCPPLPAAL